MYSLLSFLPLPLPPPFPLSPSPIISNPKLSTKNSKVKFHPKSVNTDETFFESKYMIYHTMVKSSAVFLHDTSLIPPLPLLFFGGDIAVRKDGDQDTIAVDDWIVFQASHHIAVLVKVRS